MTTSNTASPLSTTQQDKKTPSHGSAPNGRARECRECAGDVAPERGRREGFRQVGSEPTRLSTTRAHARPTRHHDDFKYWPRRSSSASRGGRPGSPCGARESTQRGGFCGFLRGVMGVGGGDVQRRASRARRRVSRRALNTPTGRGKRLCVDRTTKMHRFKINRATSQSLGEHNQRAHTVRTHERRHVACAPGRAPVDPTGREVRLCGNG